MSDCIVSVSLNNGRGAVQYPQKISRSGWESQPQREQPAGNSRLATLPQTIVPHRGNIAKLGVACQLLPFPPLFPSPSAHFWGLLPRSPPFPPPLTFIIFIFPPPSVLLSFDLILIWFWFDFDLTLIWLWFTNQNSIIFPLPMYRYYFYFWAVI